MVVMARLNTLPPNAASTAETLLLCRSGKRMVRILRKKPAPCICAAVSRLPGIFAIPPTSTRFIMGMAAATLASTKIDGVPYKCSPIFVSHFWFHTKI